MADYWKSNERKYCDYCNCWIADNKASISFHEGGKKHKAAVAKKLYDIGKKSQKDQKEQQKIDIQMRQMEEAALKAYQQDITQGLDITTQEMNAQVAAAAANYEEVAYNAASQSVPGPAAVPRRPVDPMRLPIDVFEDEERAKKLKRKAPSSGSATNDTVKENSMWVEARNEDDYPYYWNVKTGETVWDKPKEGFMTIAEYNRLNLLFDARTEQQMHQESKFMRENADDLAAKYRRENLKQFQAKPTPKEIEEKEIEKESYTSYEEPGTSAAPYGKWQTIVKKEEKPMDLQLPKLTFEKYVPVVTNEYEPPPVKTFKEKTISTLKVDEDTAAISSSFKKRKFGGNKNTRQRFNDDD